MNANKTISAKEALMDLQAKMVQQQPRMMQMLITTQIALHKGKLLEPLVTKEAGASAKIREDAKIRMATVRANSRAEKVKAVAVVVAIETNLRSMRRKRRWAGKSASSPSRLQQQRTQNKRTNQRCNTIIMSEEAKAVVSSEVRHALNDIIATRTALYQKENKKAKSSKKEELLETSLVNTSRKTRDLITEIRGSTMRLVITRKMKPAKMIQVVGEAVEELAEEVVAATEEAMVSKMILLRKKNINNKRKGLAVVAVEAAVAIEAAAKTMMAMVISSISMRQRAVDVAVNSDATMMVNTTKASHRRSKTSHVRATVTMTKSRT